MHSKAAIATRECPAIVLVAILIFAAEPEIEDVPAWGLDQKFLLDQILESVSRCQSAYRLPNQGAASLGFQMIPTNELRVGFQD